MQESGVPNVTGYVGYRGGGYVMFYNIYGAFQPVLDGHITWRKSDSGHAGEVNAYLNLSSSSNQYQNISEVRVKSIISNGYIRLY